MALWKPGPAWECPNCGWRINNGCSAESEHECDPRSVERRASVLAERIDEELAAFLATSAARFEVFCARRS